MKREKWEEFWMTADHVKSGVKLNRPLLCPTCDIGVLEKQSLLQMVPSRKSKESYENLKASVYTEEDAIELDTNITWDFGVFSFMLVCSECSETVCCTGSYQGQVGYNYIGDSELEEYYYKLTPRYFNPPLSIFLIPRDTPEPVKLEIKGAFNLYWLDQSASANRVRVSIERLMDHYKIRHTKFVRIRGVRRRVPENLNKRIELFGNKAQKYKPLAERLLANKNIGNEGSHSQVPAHSIIDSFELIADVLQKLFVRKDERLSKMAKEINLRRGSRVI